MWCTAASGWSKSARNAWIAPWLRGATALLHDARFDPQERLELIEREQVNVLCMAPTEYRVIAKRATLRKLPSLKGMVAAGEALNPEVLKVWRDAHGPGHQGRLWADRDRPDDGHGDWDSCSCRIDGTGTAGHPVEREGWGVGGRPEERGDVFPGLPR